MTRNKSINLALQGGGGHGAFTWGVLDRLLEEERLELDGISGTSAGAMNGAMLIHGYVKNGRIGARASLEEFWRRISEIASLTPLHKNPFEAWFTGWNMDMSPGFYWADLMSRMFSPYETNPLNFNPLRALLHDMLDLEALRICSSIKLFVTATHIASGQPRVFDCSEITPDVLLASACIPFMFQAIEIDGEHYWDGGYMGNPVLWPLIYGCKSHDILLVQINPLVNTELPKRAHDIINRLNEITFNSSLIAEMRAISFVSRLIKEGRLDEERYKDMHIHMVHPDNSTDDLNASSKSNADWDFFLLLKERGRLAADTWLNKHWDNIGKRSSVNIQETFLKKSWTQDGTPLHDKPKYYNKKKM